MSRKKKDGETIHDVHALIIRTESWGFILSIVIYHYLLFQINKTSKVVQIFGALLEVVVREIKATEEDLKKYRNSGYNSAVT